MQRLKHILLALILAFSNPAASALGQPAEPNAQPKAVKQTARNIVFLVDASAKYLEPKQGTLAGELGKAIEGLKPFQAFAVVVAANDRPVALNKERLMVATLENKAAFQAFMTKLKVGDQTGDPVAAFKIAANLLPKPELVYLAVDHEWKDPAAVAKEIAELKGDFRISVSYFRADSAPPSDGMVKACRAIVGKDGNYVEVTTTDLGGTDSATRPATRPVIKSTR